MSNVLLVEDEDPFGSNLIKGLAELGLVADRASDGTQAMKLLMERTYDALILDLRLPGPPGSQGMQILEWASRSADDTVVIVVTAYPHLAFRALELGVDALLYKPVEAQHVLNSVTKAIELRKLRRENKELREALDHGLEKEPIAIVDSICRRFHAIARQLKDRCRKKPAFIIEDEYDVQYLLHALLRIAFDDIRVEEWVPSWAGGSSRMDFLLKKEQLVIEVKMTRETLGAKEIGDQLTIDIGRYKAHVDCRKLYCFIYDPREMIASPQGLENDLSWENNDFIVKVRVWPKAY